MARPRKQEVDYFPHYCDHGKVLFILENHFKNDGYAVFYKIEEVLSKTEGHCYDCSRLENWEYLLSKMLIGEDIVVNIIEKLVAMGVIDADLWKEKRIWMQSFVDSITDAYARRKVSLPVKPELMSTETPLIGNNVNINPQSKVKKNKVKKNKEDILSPTNNIPYEKIIEHLNLRTGKTFKSTSDKTRGLIKARWNEGFILDQFIRVIDNQTVKWLKDPKMAEYLRPETLFGTKFESYLNAPPTAAQAGLVTPGAAGAIGWAEREEEREKLRGQNDEQR